MTNILIAQQFTPIYDEREDRLRLIFNINYPTRYDMWITRNFLSKIIYSLNEYIIENQPQNKNTPSQKDSKETIYLPTNKEVKLLESFQITPVNENTYLSRFSDSETTVEAHLTKENLSTLLKSFVKATKNFWGIAY